MPIFLRACRSSLGGQLVHRLPIEQHVPVIGLFERVDHTQERRLSRTAETDNTEDIPVRDLEADLLQCRNRLPVYKEVLVNIHKFDHRSFTFLNAPHTSSAR